MHRCMHACAHEHNLPNKNSRQQENRQATIHRFYYLMARANGGIMGTGQLKSPNIEVTAD